MLIALSVFGVIYFWVVDLIWFYLKHGNIPEDRGSFLIADTFGWRWLTFPTDYFGLNKIIKFIINCLGWGSLLPVCIIAMYWTEHSDQTP